MPHIRKGELEKALNKGDMLDIASPEVGVEVPRDEQFRRLWGQRRWDVCPSSPANSTRWVGCSGRGLCLMPTPDKIILVHYRRVTWFDPARWERWEYRRTNVRRGKWVHTHNVRRRSPTLVNLETITKAIPVEIGFDYGS